MHPRRSLSLSICRVAVPSAVLLLACGAVQAQATSSTPKPVPAALVTASTTSTAPQQPMVAAAPSHPVSGRCVPGSMAAIMSAKLPPNARPERLGHSCP